MFSKTKVIIALILLTFTAASANAARYTGISQKHSESTIYQRSLNTRL